MTTHELHVDKISDKYYQLRFGADNHWIMLFDFEEMKEIAKQIKEMGF